MTAGTDDLGPRAPVCCLNNRSKEDSESMSPSFLGKTLLIHRQSLLHRLSKTGWQICTWTFFEQLYELYNNHKVRYKTSLSIALLNSLEGVLEVLKLQVEFQFQFWLCLFWSEMLQFYRNTQHFPEVIQLTSLVFCISLSDHVFLYCLPVPVFQTF